MRKCVIAHRGASGYRPEHTLEAYRLAIDLGADYVEPDVVMTADGVLVARHENELSTTTDVADHPELADRRTSKQVDGVHLTGWFSENLTLDELRTLRARERLPALRAANTGYDGELAVPTLDEVLTMLSELNAGRATPVGLCVELKHPTYFESIGLPPGQPLLDCLARHGADDPTTIVESMEATQLRWLRPRTSARLIQLFMAKGQPYDLAAAGDPRTHADLARPAGFREIATYADLVGLEKVMVVPRDAHGRSGAETTLVADAHAAGLDFFVWTMRDENRFLPAELRSSDDRSERGNAVAEYLRFFDIGVDGVFSDHTDTAVAARRDWEKRVSAAPA